LPLAEIVPEPPPLTVLFYIGSLLALIHPFGEACQKELKIAIKYVSVIIKNYT
jgi:hypothetical protein